MVYSIALLLLVLGLIVAVPALRKLLYMQQIKKNSKTTLGRVKSIGIALNPAASLLGMFVASEMVDHQRPLITYEPMEGKEMSVEVRPSNFLSRRKYEVDEAIEVVYDRSDPWRAYPIREWAATARDLWLSLALSVLAGILWIMGRAYNLPF